MLAYHNDVKIREDILIQLQAHYDADEIVKGYYWENGRGNAVGCTLHSCNHKEYEERFGIPVQLAYLEDRIFEGLPNDLAKQWPLRFMRAIKVGIDISKVWPKFAIWLLSDSEYGVIKYVKNDKTRKIIQDDIDLYKKSLIKPFKPGQFKSMFSAFAISANAYGKAAADANIAAMDYTDVQNLYAGATAFAVAAAAYADNEEDYAAVWAASEYAAYARCRDKQNHYILQSEKLLEILKNTF